MTTKPRVLQITTLDTKQEEGFYVRDCLEAAGVEVLLMNPAVRGAADLAAAITPDQIAAAAGTTMDQIRAIGPEGQLTGRMVTGVRCRAAPRGAARSAPSRCRICGPGLCWLRSSTGP